MSDHCPSGPSFNDEIRLNRVINGSHQHMFNLSSYLSEKLMFSVCYSFFFIILGHTHNLSNPVKAVYTTTRRPAQRKHVKHDVWKSDLSHIWSRFDSSCQNRDTLRRQIQTDGSSSQQFSRIMLIPAERCGQRRSVTTATHAVSTKTMSPR